ncbi:hypothetical protein QAD02_017702 [Eretmocerus hayati]|uniref:Uncharacterized protein n=1 Tax=Eretmocerus hayati TaxID=131215 RepID=A0ACC2PEC2_9HYME|nr:hypothetical protein QAD02_017702 [Eretmocerus hayati]
MTEPNLQAQTTTERQAEQVMQDMRNESKRIIDEVNGVIAEGDPSQVKRTSSVSNNVEMKSDAEQRVSIIEIAGNNNDVTNEKEVQISKIKITGNNAEVTNKGATQISDIRGYGNNIRVTQQNVAQWANVTVAGNNPTVQVYACQSHKRVIQMSHDRDQNPYVMEVEEWVQDNVLKHVQRMTNYGTRTIEESGFTRQLSEPNAPEEPLPRKISKLPSVGPDDGESASAQS